LTGIPPRHKFKSLTIQKTFTTPCKKNSTLILQSLIISFESLLAAFNLSYTLELSALQLQDYKLIALYNKLKHV
jgi:hypothetical protein